MAFTDSNWCQLSWTDWIPFSEAKDQEVPRGPGFYRVKPIGQEKLFYIGETGRNLKERVVWTLVRQTESQEMPFNDPHTAAPSLWAWQEAEQISYEFSVAPRQMERQQRRAIESYLLWQYRVETGSSVQCNHGKFHPQFVKSKSSKSQFRGGRLANGHLNPAGGTSSIPLQRRGTASDSFWMGLAWSPNGNLRQPQDRHLIPTSTGLYKLLDLTTHEIVYIGQASNLKKRLTDHSKKEWQSVPIGFSYVDLSTQSIQVGHMLNELENDLIGAFWEEHRRSPRFQFRAF